ncbi:4Fe-4S binding protein [Synechococcus sp. HB1133]|uniref:4Fe-4S binding protein n=1 Tax=unclassified Synechococcus TaxID=2626047 RepID=UPI001407220C|nr:4Fe-4S binding protein [Synechococcus sp. PH41509]MCB4421684.1 4Fe-4S binding protein [Synechococcus sp. HB1133]MCB4430964.1 4Fe-4S binding protein [Synechococcus sp. HBA1120]NHI80626.1 4Fe-4S binding protein [Synechococcus sp. HB1133]
MAESSAGLQRLAPFVLGRARRGVVGSSRYAQRLRSAVLEAARDPQRQPVLISGEPGLEKDNLAALVHYGSAERRRLLVRLDASDLQGSTLNLLNELGSSTLLVSGMDRIDNELQQRLIAMARGEAPGFQGRVLFTSEAAIPALDGLVRTIRVPPLRVRRTDLGDWLRYRLRLQSPGLGWSQPPALPDSVVRRLQNHDFANNLRELEAMVDRALRQARQQSQGELPPLLPEEVFWTEEKSRRTRFDIWRWKPQLREWMRAPALWNTLLFGLVSWLFVAVNLALWLGPQERAVNPMLTLFWAWWWPLILLSYPLVGRLWCSICPFMVWGQIAQRLTPWRKRSWPHGDLDRWGAPALAAGFAAILLWEEVWNLEDTAWLSSCLLLLITAGAVISSTVFEKRFWCRYLCPIGGMNGLFAKLSILELRAEVGTCSGSCSSYSCFKGGPADGEGLATEGCPLGTHPAHLSDNRNCVLCMTCTQACPNRSVQLRLRPPAADLQRNMQAPDGERGLLLVLAGGLCLHHWQRLLGWLPLAPSSLHEGPLLARLSFGALALALPAAAGLWLKRRWLYAGLPLLWALLLARHLPIGMAEAGTVLPVGWPQWSADPHVIGFCQTVVVVIGWVGAVILSRRLLDLNRRAWIRGSMVLFLVSLSGRWLVAL